MPSEWLPAPASPHDTASLSRRFTNDKGTARLFLVLCLQTLIRVIFLVVLICVCRRKGPLCPPFLKSRPWVFKILLCWVSLRIHLGRPLPFLRICRGRSFMRSLFPMIRLWATVFLLFLLPLWAMLLIIWRYPASKGSLRSLLLFLRHLNFQRTVCRRGFPRPPLL